MTSERACLVLVLTMSGACRFGDAEQAGVTMTRTPAVSNSARSGADAGTSMAARSSIRTQPADAGDAESSAYGDAGGMRDMNDQAASPAPSGPTNTRSLCAGRIAGAIFCDKTTLVRCDGSGNARSETCESVDLCQAGIQSAVCAKCLPGSHTCDAAILLTCNASGQYGKEGKPYDSPETCRAAAMAAEAGCSKDKYKCIDDALYKCDATANELVRDLATNPCAKGFCNEQLGKCNACIPGFSECADTGDGVLVCSDDGQTRSTRACDPSTPICVSGVCEVCRVDSTQDTGCGPDETCVHMNNTSMCQSASLSAETAGLLIEFCHAGACKVRLAPSYDLDFKVDWSECTGSHADAPLTADTAGVMLWPTALLDLAIPLADTGWICKLPPNRGTSECIVAASHSTRELYIWGPAETGCSFLWGETPDGIDAVLGAGCGMCQLEQMPERDAASYAFNMGTDRACRCPKVSFAAVPAKPN